MRGLKRRIGDLQIDVKKTDAHDAVRRLLRLPEALQLTLQGTCGGLKKCPFVPCQMIQDFAKRHAGKAHGLFLCKPLPVETAECQNIGLGRAHQMVKLRGIVL